MVETHSCESRDRDAQERVPTIDRNNLLTASIAGSERIRMVDGVKGSNTIGLLFYGENRGNRFLNDLENHLTKLKKNDADQYDRVPGVLNYKTQTTSASLDPSSLKKYSGYFTALSYDKRARFVNNIADGIDALKKGNLA